MTAVLSSTVRLASPFVVRRRHRIVESCDYQRSYAARIRLHTPATTRSHLTPANENRSAARVPFRLGLPSAIIAAIGGVALSRSLPKFRGIQRLLRCSIVRHPS